MVSRGSEAPDGTLLAHSLEEAFVLAETAAESAERCFVIGGGQIYAQALQLADRLIVTHVHTMIDGADTFFPQIDPLVWKEDSRSEMMTDPETGWNFEFVEYINSLKN